VTTVKPRRSYWALGLFLVAGVLAISAVLHEIREATREDMYPSFSRFTMISGAIKRVLVGLLPALFTTVVGVMVQYLADIRWALLSRLEDDNA